MILIFLLLLAAFQASMVDYLYNNPTYYQLDSLTWETEAFRAMELGELVCGEDELDLDALTGGFNLQIAWSTGHLAGESVP